MKETLLGVPPMLSHNVYFELKEATAATKEALIAACRKYLTGHDGVVFFSVGTLAEEYTRPVNDRGWHVALNVVFATPADQDRYQVDPRHEQFMAENRANWKSVRVFDSHVL